MYFRPDMSRDLHKYEYAVIVRPDERDCYEKGQILTVETTGDTVPIEVGTWTKPGGIGCQCVVVSTVQDAINLSYAVANGQFVVEEGESPMEVYKLWKNKAFAKEAFAKDKSKGKRRKKNNRRVI